MFPFFYFLFFLCKAVQQQCTTLYEAEYLRVPSTEGLCREPLLPCWPAWMFCIERRFNSLCVCGKVAHGALIRADKRIREIHSASGGPNLCFKCCERSENSQTSRAVDKQTSRGGVANLTRIRIGVCARLCARSPSVMRHKVCLSALTRCFGASPTSSAKPRRLDKFEKRAVPPPFSRSACRLR